MVKARSSVRHGPFPTYLKRFNIRNSNSCGCGNLGNPLHYATSYLFTISHHLRKPSTDLEPLWWERVMNNNNSRAKIRKRIHFIAENETLFFPKDGDKIMFVTGHSRHILNDVTSETAIPVAAETWGAPYTMLQATCYNLIPPNKTVS
ncbi:hypothetical protein AVEN_58611-1 [Araneus ventricosus]|uniref:Uncharacterized protein n=1 Tax=Araneus ventricosus TaxID=182803 RepID=A0A4Y2K7W4_ARAVE|nr:hypothetical protein AVEN_58611-1 [Araneus ventricosus]